MTNLKQYIVNVDIDNVLNNYTETVLAVHNSLHHTSITLDDITYYGIETVLGMTVEEYRRAYEAVTELCTPLEGAVTGLRYLNDTYTTYVTTARSFKQFGTTNRFFDTYFPFIREDQIIRCIDKRIIKADIIIDDGLHNIINAPCGKILFDYPWNRNVTDSEHLITRVRSWEEIVQAVDLMLK